ncbi:MAG: hypothetical protein ACRDP8_27040 [Actinopolymorphaceae bacterium]
MADRDHTLPWPSRWSTRTDHPDRVVPRSLFMLLLGAIGIWMGVDSVQEGSRAGAAFGFLMGWMFLGLGGSGFLTMRRQRRRGTIGVGWVEELSVRAVVIPSSRSMRLGILLMTVGFLPFTGMFALASGIDLVEGGWDLDSLVVGSVSAFVFLVMLIFLVTVLRRRRGERMHVAICANGIYHRGSVWRAYFPWEEIARVEATDFHGPFITLHPYGGDNMYVKDLRRFKLLRLTPEIPANKGVDAALVAVDPTVVYYGIRFYHENPKLRAELEHEAGAERFRRANFPLADNETHR